MCLLAVKNSHIMRIKSSIPLISSIVPVCVGSLEAVSCSIAMMTSCTEGVFIFAVESKVPGTESK